MARFRGSNRDDFFGIPNNEGNDKIDGRGGNDTLFGGKGDDSISGDDGNDVLDGGAGDDDVFGDRGDDILEYSVFDNRLPSGPFAQDLYDGGKGYDVLKLRLTLDVSHVSVAEAEGTAAQAIRDHAGSLALVHLEDAPLGRHEHLPFGEGELPIPGILLALEEIGFAGLCAVELSRHSHAAHELVGQSMRALRAAEGQG